MELNMNNRVLIITTCLIGAGLLAVATFVSVERKTLADEPPIDPAHAAHVAAADSQTGGQTVDAQLAEMGARIQQLEAIIQQQPGQSPPGGTVPMGAGNPPRVRPMPGLGSGAKAAPADMAGMDMTGGGKVDMAGGQAVADQLAELRAKMQQLEATMQQQSESTSGAMPMSGKPGMKSGTKPMQGKMADMSGMGEGNPPSGGASGAMKPAAGIGEMGGGASPPGGEMDMMGMMTDRMKEMKDKMMGGMDGGAPAAGAPMGKAAPGGGMGMGMMDMDKMEMAGMMGMVSGMDGKGGSSMAMPSALPGFPGASHLYHVGATGFFLDHPQHIALSTEQQMMLNQIKEKAALDKASAGRCVQEAEQDLWTLTAADQPDNAQIEAKIAEIEKLRGDARLRFIRSVGEAAKVLSDEQRQIVTGMASPAQPATGSPGPHKH
ncbi:MAG: Spy/CpxP family protein refolding chaperone [Pirellulaceae bacterium]